MKITLRQAKPSDVDWLEPFYESLMRPYVELTHQWDDSVFRARFQPEYTSIIQLRGKDIGMFKVEPCEEYLFLGDIQIDSEHQGQGIGSALIADLCDAAQQANLPIRLRVMNGNPARQFYERRGFRKISDLENCVEMEWRAPSRPRKK
ncbi:GNAT family N-acetyltransferase [Cerasicoccus frondis]|uniref:GNAT family N-acetyltransferase n=1 Tax=Cerasicoccus frondis TaxID=490090 RepID=UPI002852A782|nr:GNAT family N-acetyltransferase [Cerasicoccus frondis]